MEVRLGTPSLWAVVVDAFLAIRIWMEAPNSTADPSHSQEQ
jgi:hypothetical protein